MHWFIFSLTLFFSARPAWACPVCYAANPKGLIAYYGTTILLVLLPLILFGGLLWYLRRTFTRA